LAKALSACARDTPKFATPTPLSESTSPLAPEAAELAVVSGLAVDAPFVDVVDPAVVEVVSVSIDVEVDISTTEVDDALVSSVVLEVDVTDDAVEVVEASLVLTASESSHAVTPTNIRAAIAKAFMVPPLSSPARCAPRLVDCLGP
jgi:hypothetical protein